ncbi:MAG TPA: class I SAM-dependent methyltransferase [Candidatus Bathyarchaeia archaeon]
MPKHKRIVKEWDVGSDSWIDFVRQGKDFFRDELNNPGMFHIIGNVKGLTVLDVACGEGYNTRLLASKGAKVTGIDFSEKMIKSAKSQEEKDPHDIDYYVLDSSNLSMFPAASFDLVTCFMALMDIEDYDATIREIARVMKKTGRFVFSITHPCFEYNPVNQELDKTPKYFETRSEKVPWNMERLLEPFETTSFHRTLTDYSNTLCKHGILIKRLFEPKPTKNGPRKFAPLKQILLTPHSIIMETVKNSYPRIADPK